jgi:starch phosphorylase
MAKTDHITFPIRVAVSSPLQEKGEELICPPAPVFKMPVPHKSTVVEGISMNTLQVAYFCMEMGIDNSMPTYAGGLGILAGDMLKSAADLDVPMIGVSLLYKKGYFKQHFDPSGWQREEPERWDPREKLIELPVSVTLLLEGRSVAVHAWLYKLVGIRGNVNPVIFLDTDVPENTEEDRALTLQLYTGDEKHRLLQEAILGLGGMRIIRKLGATNIGKFHMNEGHSALLTLELYRLSASCEEPLEELRRRAVFTTHTPVASGHDQFSRELVERVLGKDIVPEAIADLVWKNNMLNMTHLGLTFSHYTNGVAKKHGEVTRDLFPGYRIESITNGVHVGTWVSEPFKRLFTKYLPGWEADPYSLRYALSIPQEELWHTHQEAKQTLLRRVNERYGVDLKEDVFTIGFARRAAAYKRGNMLFADTERLIRIAEGSKGIQIIYAGKAHPHDHEGKLLIQHIIENMRRVAPTIKCVYVEGYDMDIARDLVSGVDLWLNTPTRPQEASGTSGMKAALNGVPQFSVLDGWWLEGHIENVTGWSIGPHPERLGEVDVDAEDIEDMYTKLEYVILPRFEKERDQWVKMMRQAIGINGSFFNTHRMIEQYVLNAYFKK